MQVVHQYSVNLAGKLIDTVTDERLDCTAVRRDLIDKDGYDMGIYLYYEGVTTELAKFV
jgi:hypothetical protein